MTDILRSIIDTGEGIAFLARQDVNPYLDANKAAQNDGTRGWTPSRDFKKKASIPLWVVEYWNNEYGVDMFNPNHKPAVRRLLGDPDWRWLRVDK